MTGHQLSGPAVSVTTIRLTNAKEWPKCGKAPAVAQPGGWEASRGREIVIELPPEDPDGAWDCGTPKVWRVSAAWMRKAGMVIPDYGYLCVCVHQVQAD